MNDLNKQQAKDARNKAFLDSIGFKKTFVNSYSEEIIEPNKRFLIVCEGKNTEPEYFRSFPLPAKRVVTKGGMGSKNSLVKYAISEVEKGNYEGWEVWCVFDYDVKPDEKETQANDFNSAILRAEAKGFQAAWSNDCFELWMLLHFREVVVPMHRTDLFTKLGREMGIHSYETKGKQKSFTQNIYQKLGGNKSILQEMAIKRAERLHQIHKGKSNFAEQVPCTTVYQLVMELNSQL